MYFRSLLKTRLLRPIAFGLSHPYLPLSSVCHWIKCTPGKTYFYLFSTQKQQSQKGSVKDSIENTNTKGEGETPAKNPKKLQKEININSSTKKEVEIQANKSKEQKTAKDPIKNSQTNVEIETQVNDQKEQQTANNPIKNSQTNVEIETQINDQKEQKTANNPIENSHTTVEVENQANKPKELKIEFKPQNQNSKEFQQKLEALFSRMVKELQKQNEREADPKNSGHWIFNLIDGKLIKAGIIGLIAAFIGNVIYGHYQYKYKPKIQAQENYIQSKKPPTETEQLTFVEEYIKTSSRAQVKQMLILSDQNIPREIQYISGVPGVGKTTTFKEVIKQMKEENCQISYFSFKEDDDVDKTIDKILTSTDYIQAHPKIKAQNKKKYLIIDQFNQITCKKAESTMTMEQRVAKKERIVKKMLRLTRFFRYNIVFISSDLNFFKTEILQTPGVSLSNFKCLNFNQPSIRQQTEYLKGLRSKTGPDLKLDDDIIAHMIQNYSTFREMQSVLGAYFSKSGDREKALQKSKYEMDMSKLMLKIHSQISAGQLSDKDKALYEVCLQKLMPKPVHDKFYDQLNQNNILNQRHFRSLLTLRGFELYYNENPSKFEKNLSEQVKEQFKDHKIHCKEVFLDRPAN